MNDIHKKVINASKWSTVTEVIAKLISPISNMILARILAPEIFGIVAIVNMIISFADIFTDAGFQKYLIQFEFKTEKELYSYSNVAFWTNFTFSTVLFIFIFIGRAQVATLVGAEGYGLAIGVAALNLPLTSFTSIQLALFKRNFKYDVLFGIRIVSAFIPLIVTVPLALLGFEYWSLIIGNLCGVLFQAIYLTLRSNWKPQFFFDLKKLGCMLSFSAWTLIDTVVIWLNNWVGVFIIGRFFTEYYLGIYRTSISTVNQIVAIVTNATTPILFAALSRNQDKPEEFNKLFFKFENVASYFLVPIAVGFLLYGDVITDIALGKKWHDAIGLIRIWGFMSSVSILFGNYCSEYYRAKGVPRLSAIVQIIHLLLLIPSLLISARSGFTVLYWTRTWIRVTLIISHFIIMKVKYNISFIKMIDNIKIPILGSGVMVFAFFICKLFFDSYFIKIFSILICGSVYFFTVRLFRETRDILRNFNFK